MSHNGDACGEIHQFCTFVGSMISVCAPLRAPHLLTSGQEICKTGVADGWGELILWRFGDFRKKENCINSQSFKQNVCVCQTLLRSLKPSPQTLVAWQVQATARCIYGPLCRETHAGMHRVILRKRPFANCEFFSTFACCCCSCFPTTNIKQYRLKQKYMTTLQWHSFHYFFFSRSSHQVPVSSFHHLRPEELPGSEALRKGVVHW